MSAAYTFGFGLEGGASLTAGSGSPINEFGTGTDYSTPIFLVPRGSVGRTPVLWDLALRLAYELPLRRGPRARIVLDVLHVGNPRRATTVDEILYPTPDQAVLNPQYKQPLAYQAPMAARVGVEITF